MNRLSTVFARRYYASKKSHSVINIISRVSSFAVGIPVAAMVVLLSVFNGFDDLIRGMSREFDPDLLITLREGKTFADSLLDSGSLLDIEGVEAASRVLEDNALLEYRGRQFIATLRGVDSAYFRVTDIGKLIVADDYVRNIPDDVPQGIFGSGVAYNLGIRTALYDLVNVYVPRRGSFSSLMPLENYSEDSLYPSEFFTLDAETDGKYVIAPIEFARALFDYPAANSQIMIRLRPDANPEKTAAAISERIGERFSVLTRAQQKASFYRIMAYEKWGIFIIALMVLVIASFSIVGSLVMLIIDKRDDIRTMVSMGADTRLLRSIFMKEGMLLGSAGALFGLIFGVALCWAQQSFGLITIPADTFLVSAYPVSMQWQDIAVVALSFVAVNYIIAKFTTVRMIRREDMMV
jgi:lipoprotein-releasing system permease protein